LVAALAASKSLGQGLLDAQVRMIVRTRSETMVVRLPGRIVMIR
ncbi:MAG: hypothetical protein PWP23_3254, partial [Candidatus Sumerlaeota bacterium]|nr:hypothetical protein [Candidatus Sumerlaeota bacterium]